MGQLTLILMKDILKKYAESFCSSSNDFRSEAALKAVNWWSQDRAESICNKLKLIPNVQNAEVYDEWNNNRCRLIDVELARGISERLDLYLTMRISRIAPVVTLYWKNYEMWSIGEMQVPAGKKFLGDVSSAALAVKENASDIVHLAGYFVVPATEFDFGLNLYGDERKSLQTISGACFFFGAEL